jgi:hypothetical protein
VFGRKPQLLRARRNFWRAFDVHDIIPAGVQSGIGWDFPTGLGTPNVNNLVLGWPRLPELRYEGVNFAPATSPR